MIRGEATATLADGRTLTLAMGFRALAFASAKAQMASAEMFNAMKSDDGRQLKALLALIEGSLQKYHREIGEDEIDELMFSDHQALSEAVSVAMNTAFSDEKDDKADEGNVPTGTGTRSKATGQKRG